MVKNNEIQEVGTAGELSMQVYQDVYNKMTGKTEKISQVLFDPHLVRFSDLEHLNSLIADTMEQYSHCEKNCSVSVKYSDGKSENFSGFNRFKGQALNRPIPTVQVEIQYDFLLSLPNTTEPKPYKIIVGLRSSLGIIDSFKRTNASDFEKTIFYDVDMATGRLEIRYIDLAVARSLEACVKEWYSGLARTSTGKLSKVTNRLTVPFGVIFLASTLSILAFFVLRGLAPSITDSASLFRALIITFPAAIVGTSVARIVANKVTEWLKRTGPYSVVALSESDLALEKKAKNNTVFAWLKSLAALVGTSIFGLVESKIVLWIG